jgi:hypothetical protein
MYIFLDESYNLKDRTKPQFVSINGFRAPEVTPLWKRWKAMRLPYVGKARIHATDRLFEPLRKKCLKYLASHPDTTLLSAMQEIKMIPMKGETTYYSKDGLLFDNVYADLIKELLKSSHPYAYKEVHVTIDSTKQKRNILGKQQLRKNVLAFLKNQYPNTLASFEVQPSTSNILLEIADFISNSFYRKYIGHDMPMLDQMKGRTVALKNPLKERG